MQLNLRRASASRISGSWQHEDYDVFDGDRDVGRIYLMHAYGGTETLVLGRVVRSDPPQQLRPGEIARRGEGGVPGGIRAMEANRQRQAYLIGERSRPHGSSTRNRSMPGAVGFLTFTHELLGPDRYGCPRCFETMPSNPSLQACSKIM